MTIYTHEWTLAIESRLRKIKVEYAFPYMPTGGDDWDEENSEHQKFITHSKRVYSTKAKGTGAYFYLLKELNDDLRRYMNNLDVNLIVPTPSSSILVGKFAQHVANLKRCVVVECMEKISDSNYKPKVDIQIPKGNLLLVDDITTSGGAIQSALNCLIEGFGISHGQVNVLCLGKTERDYELWDSQKVIKIL